LFVSRRSLQLSYHTEEEDSVVTLRLSGDSLALLGRHAIAGGPSAWTHVAISSHAAMLDLLDALGCQ
jgi:hypothetical protein